MQNRYKTISYSRKIISVNKDNEASSFVDNNKSYIIQKHHITFKQAATEHIIIVLPAMNDLWVKRW